MNNTWNADQFTKVFSFIHQYGNHVLELIDELQWFTYQDSLNCDMPPSFKACINHYHNAGYCNDYVYVAVGTINADGNVEHTITPLMAY